MIWRIYEQNVFTKFNSRDSIVISVINKFQLLIVALSAGLFDETSSAQESSFQRAVTAVNDDRSILTKSLVTAGRIDQSEFSMLTDWPIRVQYGKWLTTMFQMLESIPVMTASKPASLCVILFSLVWLVSLDQSLKQHMTMFRWPINRLDQSRKLNH